MTAAQTYLTKSRILSGRHCPRRLWLELYRPDLVAPPAADALHMMRQGQAITERARRAFTDGQWPQPDRSALELVADPAITTLFEAGFSYNGVTVRVDILTRLADGGWHLIEVKSSGRVKDDQRVDAAIQAYVLRGAGVDVQRVSLWTINKAVRYPELSNLFEETDVTVDAVNLLHEIDSDVARLHSILQGSQQPAVALGRQCKECPFKATCWQHLDGMAIFSIPRLNSVKADELRAAGIEHLADLPDAIKLSPAQERYRRVMLNNQPDIDRATIVREFEKLTFPLYFLDFEADSPALPRFDGFAPFQEFPFQFSCHVLFTDGREQHHAYLHDGMDDPRLPLVEALTHAIGRKGSIVVYHATFERSVLANLADAFPQHAPALRSMIDRLWDQELIFNKHYCAPGFGGSSSLKAVLPVLVPSLNYGDLVVQNGMAAIAAWNEYIAMPRGAERDALRQHLLDYCYLDTKAMVALHQTIVDQVIRQRSAR